MTKSFVKQEIVYTLNAFSSFLYYLSCNGCNEQGDTSTPYGMIDAVEAHSYATKMMILPSLSKEYNETT